MGINDYSDQIEYRDCYDGLNANKNKNDENNWNNDDINS